MPRFVRRTPLIDRIKARLDPYDFILWLLEELNDDAYDEWIKLWATPVGLALNFAFIVARGASRPSAGDGADDVFGDGRSGAGWLSYIVSTICFC